MDNDDTPADQPAAAPEPTPEPAPVAATPPAEPVAPPQQRWRDRVFRFRAVLAVGVASLLLGLGAGTATTLALDHDDADHFVRHERMGGPGERGGFPGRNAPQDGGVPLPPGMPQQQDDEGIAPQDDSTSSS